LHKEPIIAIDGPSGAGKSTLSKRLAHALGYINIDTGAMYRSVALASKRAAVDLKDSKALENLCRSVKIHFERGNGEEKVFLNDENVSDAIRTPEISLLTSQVAAFPVVREAMVRLQRQMGETGGVVLEGRDIGSVVFPQAEVKFFLSATARERGRRRYEELKLKGLDVDLEQTIREVEERDAADASRTHAPLVQAADAIAVDTTGLDIQQVFDLMIDHILQRRRQLGLPDRRQETVA